MNRAHNRVVALLVVASTVLGLPAAIADTFTLVGVVDRRVDQDAGTVPFVCMLTLDLDGGAHLALIGFPDAAGRWRAKHHAIRANFRRGFEQSIEFVSMKPASVKTFELPRILTDGPFAIGSFKADYKANFGMGRQHFKLDGYVASVTP